MLQVPARFVRNHPSQSKLMDPDDAGQMLLSKAAEKTGIPLEQANILDIGCGTRFAAAIVNRDIPVRSYTGVDVHKGLIDWLIEVTKDQPRLRFAHWNVTNAQYNPSGEPFTPEVRLPVEGRFNLITFFSVFTHLSPEDSRAMLRVVQEHLCGDGKVFLTVFVHADLEQDFIDRFPKRPLLKAEYRQEFFESLISEAGFAVDSQYPPATLMSHHYVLSLAT